MTGWVDVDLGAFAANLQRIRTTVAPAAHMLVVKDDAYGHGLPAIVARARDEGIAWFGTFDVPTAVRVREQAGPGCRILAWTVYDDGDVDAALDADIELGIGDAALLHHVVRHRGAGRGPARVHVKIDTGLHRNGIRPEDWPAAVARARTAVAAGMLRVEGVWSHIAEASDDEDDASRAVFLEAAGAFGDDVLRHLSASAASFARPEFRFDLVRIGAFAYGIRPEGGPEDGDLGITPIATLMADVVEAGPRDVLLNVGSLDGIDSRLAGRLRVGTPGGRRLLESVGPTSSRVEAWEGARAGQPVALIGGRAPATATDAAEILGTIGEEVVLRFSPRLPRRYR